MFFCFGWFCWFDGLWEGTGGEGLAGRARAGGGELLTTFLVRWSGWFDEIFTLFFVISPNAIETRLRTGRACGLRSNERSWLVCPISPYCTCNMVDFTGCYALKLRRTLLRFEKARYGSTTVPKGGRHANSSNRERKRGNTAMSNVARLLPAACVFLLPCFVTM